MRTGILPAMGVAAAVALAAPSAQASELDLPRPDELVAAGVAVLALAITDIGLSLHDVANLASPQPASAAYGTLETIAGGTQLAFGLAAMSSSNADGFWTGYSIWMGALTVHGIWTIIASGARPAAPAPAPDPPSTAPDPSLQISFGPTYAPVGQLAHPGFGLLARF